MKKKSIVSMLVAFYLAFGVLFSSVSAKIQSEQAFDNKIVKRLKVNNIYNHIEALSKEPRVAGTEAEWKAVQYIKRQFDSYGYESELQPFTFIEYKAPTKVSVNVNGDTVAAAPFTYTPNGDVNGELDYIGLGTPDDIKGKDLTNKIALIKRGEITFGEKVINAANAGAKAVIIFNHLSGELNGTLGNVDNRFVPTIAMTKEQGDILVEKLNSGDVLSASITIAGSVIEEKTSHNVIAKKDVTHKQKDTNQVIVIGAHYDFVPTSPGANDDASGTAVTLELARVLAKVPTDTEIHFITFGAEELGLIGSNKYVDSLTDVEIDRIVGMFQLDMVGSKDAGELVMFTVDGEKNLVTDLSAAAGVRTGTPLTYGQEGRSDHVPFYYAGIPAALFIHSPTEPWYHTPEDSLDKISKEKLLETAKIVGSAAYQIARPDTPALERAKVAPKEVDYEKMTGGLK
ncbi:M28 family peptidase [Bacillus aquiflavi]|uniref:M28 family metallopeptidase n=1 Tax=Bacillus aquiflavi TaxID=2672567 RepID=A0A6B3VV70_9BACI|nr:M28 family peptidase [Bacillus aquiflavi]MBA4536515.1 M28 family peptidase [Bacillus aquiflavi]NEY80882.1 M28 family metallopeptidase [Bacillus aquiflavi]